MDDLAADLAEALAQDTPHVEPSDGFLEWLQTPDGLAYGSWFDIAEPHLSFIQLFSALWESALIKTTAAWMYENKPLLDRLTAAHEARDERELGIVNDELSARLQFVGFNPADPNASPRWGDADIYDYVAVLADFIQNSRDLRPTAGQLPPLRTIRFVEPGTYQRQELSRLLETFRPTLAELPRPSTSPRGPAGPAVRPTDAGRQ